jgi:DnaJ-class molecular chaperone
MTHLTDKELAQRRIDKLLADAQAPRNKCSNCDGEGGSVYPDGLSAEQCTKCKGTGYIKTTNE